MRLYAKHTRLIPNSGGQWDIDSGATHAGDGGRTSCGLNVGSEDKGWFDAGYFTGNPESADLDCARCRKALSRYAAY
jgi:hypothetical protein